MNRTRMQLRLQNVFMRLCETTPPTGIWTHTLTTLTLLEHRVDGFDELLERSLVRRVVQVSVVHERVLKRTLLISQSPP